MKKRLFACIALLLLSCNVNDDSLRSYQTLLPIESVTIPDAFIIDDVYAITLFYIKPTNCHSFSDIYYSKDHNERTVSIISTVYTNANCNEINAITEASFNFKATSAGTYKFMFWSGKDENNEDIYLNYEIPVIE
ncbi:hypothetical protein ES677_05010 [Bizionia gelidisalsuginis]|uniref:GOLD domain-containing protein n=2 Tax=Bizionia TaxID=283785 RepID=A0A8H2LM73_9FLAO|nr:MULTISPECIES: hypothetical protein [Bizionia]TYB74242.1 hypothetical protein ES676_08660 [Bizionia saleffrena]TYC15704.1 hypothetical protein ES677_05010 [Bizionia gelidisalsuginis]